MEIGFFIYSILLILICAAASFMNLAGFFVSYRRTYIAAAAMFMFYILDLSLIFQYEFMMQNMTYPPAFFYDVDYPIAKTVLAAGFLGSFWYVVCDYLDIENKVLIVTPIVLFFVACFLVLTLIPEGQFRQWAYYSQRQVFLLFIAIYAYVYYRKETDTYQKVRLAKSRPLFIIMVVITVLILLEDTYVIMFMKPDFRENTFPLYLSERNFSENIMIIFFAYVGIREAGHLLTLRARAIPSTVMSSANDNYAANELPLFIAKYDLTKREGEILAEIIQERSFQEIANDFHISPGTVKRHSYNIYRKSGVNCKKDLLLKFWGSEM